MANIVLKFKKTDCFGGQTPSLAGALPAVNPLKSIIIRLIDCNVYFYNRLHIKVAYNEYTS